MKKLGAETQIYCDLDFENDKNTIIDNAAQMIAKISSRAAVELGEIVELAFDAKHIHLFDGYTESTMLERDEHYEVIPENAEGAAFVPPTPQEMQAQIDAARVVTKEMKKQAKRDARMEARRQAAAAAEEAKAVEAAPAPAEAPEVPAEAPVETPVEAPVETPAPVEEVKEEPAPAPVEEPKAEEKPAAKKPAAKKPSAPKKK